MNVIGRTAFYSAPLPLSFRLPASLTIIGQAAFYGVSMPQGVQLPKNLERFGVTDDANDGGLSTVLPTIFYNVVFAPGFTLPDTVKEIGEGTFFGSTFPLGFAIPSSTRIFSSDKDRNLVTSTDTALASVNIPDDRQWDNPKGPVAGAKVVLKASQSNH